MTASEQNIRRIVGIDAGDEWPGFAWPGGYPIVYLMDDGEVLGAECMNEQDEVHFSGDADGWRVDAADIHWEGPDLTCAHCGRTIESAYGDPEQVTG